MGRRWLLHHDGRYRRAMSRAYHGLPNLIVCPVGVGSLAQAVIAHYRNRDLPSTMMTVEPDTAACLKTSLGNGKMTSVITANTKMCGMNCGTASMTAWPFLREGVDASIMVTDNESAKAQEMLRDVGINMGPCSAVTLAALLSVSEAKKENRSCISIAMLGLFCWGPKVREVKPSECLEIRVVSGVCHLCQTYVPSPKFI